MAIREAGSKDLEAVHNLIQELAEYEKAPDEVSLTLEQLKADFERDKPGFGILVAVWNEQIVGMALYYFTYSTWKGRCLYLEDMVVKSQCRNQGIGTKLFENLITIAAQNSAQRMAWQVLDWNEPAIRFYKKYNAYLDPSWVNGKFSGDQIHELAKTFKADKQD